MKNSNRNHNICLPGYGMMTCVDIHFCRNAYVSLTYKNTLYWKKATFNLIHQIHTLFQISAHKSIHSFPQVERHLSRKSFQNGPLPRIANCSQLACQQRT